MRWRLGLLQDAAAVERQAAKEAAAEAAKKHKHSSIPTVKTETQMKAEEEAAARAAKEASEPPKPRPRPKIRPLSEAKAIESGATFISETFLFSVAAGLLLFESWRSRRKESNRRDDVAERLNDLEESENAARRALVELEREVLRLRAKEGNSKSANSKNGRILPREIYEEKEEEKEEPTGIFARISAWVSTNKADGESVEVNDPGPAEKILVESDKALAEKRKHAAEAAAIEEGAKR